MRLNGRSAVNGAAIFLVGNLIIESFGWVVGAPGAAERTTMVTILTLGNIAAALTGGAVMGWKLAKENELLNKP